MTPRYQGQLIALLNEVQVNHLNLTLVTLHPDDGSVFEEDLEFFQ